MIAMFGTFDVENFGDLLFPFILKYELSERRPDQEVRLFSYRALSKENWYYDVGELSTFRESVGDFDLIVIGGGHLVRFDKAVAPGYHPQVLGLHHPTSYWLNPALLGISCCIPIAWSAVGVSTNIPTWSHQLVRAALEGSDYVSVRDQVSFEALSSLQPRCETHIVPDTAFGISRIISLGHEGQEFREFINTHSLSEKYIVCQPSPMLFPWANDVLRTLALFREHGYDVVILPISPTLGDSSLYFHTLGEGIRYVEKWPHPLSIAEIIARSTAVIGISLHLSIVALVFGVPVIRPKDKGLSKYSLLNNIDGVYDVASYSLDDFDDMLIRREERRCSPVVVDSQHKLDRHWDCIAALVGSDCGRVTKSLVLRDILSNLPFLLEHNA
jgi:lipopolysaccharide transport system ATP-binding protein